MKDLTPLFREAAEHKKHYDESAALHVANTLASVIAGSVVDWEIENENWGRIILDQREILFISSVIPACLAEEWVRRKIERVLKESDIVGIYTDRMSLENFKIDPGIVKEIFDVDPTYRVDCNCISLHDIWFVTI